MKIVMVYGNTRHGSTWHFADLLRDALGKKNDIKVQEFFLPRDMPNICLGCFSCFYKGEDTCPHAQSVSPIAGAIAQADVIVLASPVYAMDVTGAMKSLFDHLCYRWLPHRPDPLMFSKIGVTVSTTAGAGLGHTTKTMRQSLRYWGVRHAFSLKMAVAAGNWDEVTPEKRTRMKKQAEAVARRVERAAKRPFGSPMRRVMFFFIKKMMKSGKWTECDRNYWAEKGWLDGVNPFKTKGS